MGNKTPETIIRLLNESVPFAESTFTRGGCFHLYLMLLEVFPEAEPYYSFVEGHVYTKIGVGFYDIKGKHRNPDVIPMKSEPNLLKLAYRWAAQAQGWKEKTLFSNINPKLLDFDNTLCTNTKAE